MAFPLMRYRRLLCRLSLPIGRLELFRVNCQRRRERYTKQIKRGSLTATRWAVRCSRSPPGKPDGPVMKLNQLRYFAVLAEELHFRKAAERIGITQAPL